MPIVRILSSGTFSLGIAAPLVDRRTYDPSTVPHAGRGVGDAASFVPNAAPPAFGQPLGVPRERRLKTGAGRTLAR